MSCTCTQDTACDNAMPGSIEVKGDLILHEGSTLNFGCCDDDCNCQSGGSGGDGSGGDGSNGGDSNSNIDIYLNSVTTNNSGLSTLTMNSGNTFTIQQAVTSVNGQTGDVVIDPVVLGVMPYQQKTYFNHAANTPAPVSFNMTDPTLKRDVHALILKNAGSAGSNPSVAEFNSNESSDFNSTSRMQFDGQMHPAQTVETISMINERATGSARIFSAQIDIFELNDIKIEAA